MTSLVEDDLTRATTFFALALGIAVVLGFLMGDLRLGVRWGLGLGAAFAVFAYFFVRPTAGEESPADAPSDGNDPTDDPGGPEQEGGNDL